MAMRRKNKAKAAFICGVASCASRLTAFVFGYILFILLPSSAWDIVILHVCFIVFGMISAIVGLLFCRSATKEPGAHRSGFFTAGLILSVLGFVFSCRWAFAIGIY